MKVPKGRERLKGPLGLLLLIRTEDVSRVAPHEISNNVDRFLCRFGHDQCFRYGSSFDNFPQVLHLNQNALEIQHQAEMNLLPAESAEWDSRFRVIFQSFVITAQRGQDHEITSFPLTRGISITPSTMRA